MPPRDGPIFKRWEVFIMKKIVRLAMLGVTGTASSLKPGEYVTEGAWGDLSLRPGNGNSLIFSIEATGGNMHVCSLDGEVNGGTATLEGPDQKTPCFVTL